VSKQISADRRRGFTLIELLVVIAIIGILASMVFPVFARARESARKAVCLSNVKNIALAFQMYLADNNDTLMTDKEYGQEALDYVETVMGGECGWQNGFNPYLRTPVILDEYIRNREVWRCPSGRYEFGAAMMVPVTDFVDYWRAWEGNWQIDGIGNSGPCMLAWPNGWGGEITDSLLQERLASSWGEEGIDPAHRAFVMQIGTNVSWYNSGLKLCEVEDPVWMPICGDAGPNPMDMSVAKLLIPDVCGLGCVADFGEGIETTRGDWVNCPWAADCGASMRMKVDPSEARKYARHLGGSNIGFMDGHAAWWSQGQLKTEGPRAPGGGFDQDFDRSLGRLIRIQPGGPTTDKDGVDVHPCCKPAIY